MKILSNSPKKSRFISQKPENNFLPTGNYTFAQLRDWHMFCYGKKGRPVHHSMNISGMVRFITDTKTIIKSYPVKEGNEEGKAYGSKLTKNQIRDMIHSCPLSRSEKAVLTVFINFQNRKTGVLNVTRERIAKEANYSISTIEKVMTSLVRMFPGIIRRDQYHPEMGTTRVQTFVDWDALFASLVDMCNELISGNKEGVPVRSGHQLEETLPSPISSSFEEECTNLTTFTENPSDARCARSEEIFITELKREDFSVEEFGLEKKKEEIEDSLSSGDLGFSTETPENNEMITNTDTCDLTRSKMTALSDDEMVHVSIDDVRDRLDAVVSRGRRVIETSPSESRFSRDEYPVEWEYAELNGKIGMSHEVLRSMVVADGFFVWFGSIVERSMRLRWERSKERTEKQKSAPPIEAKPLPISPQAKRQKYISELHLRFSHESIQDILQQQNCPSLEDMKIRMRTHHDYDPFKQPNQYYNTDTNIKYARMSITHRVNQFLDDLRVLFDGRYSFQGKHGKQLKEFMELVDSHKGDYFEWLTACIWAIPTDRLYLNNILSMKWAEFRYNQWEQQGKPKIRHIRGNVNYNTLRVLKHTEDQKNGVVKRKYKKRKKIGVMEEIRENLESFYRRRNGKRTQ